MPFARSVAGETPRRRPRPSKSIVPTTSERFAGIGDEGSGQLRRLRPSRRDASTRRGSARRRSRGRRPRAATRSARRAGTASPPRACCRSAPCASSPARPRARGRPAASGHRRHRRAARSARSRAGLSSASQRPPSEREGLLRREVVGVGLTDVDRQAAGARGRVDQDERFARVLRALHRHHDARRGLVVRPGDHVGVRVGDRMPGRRRARPRPRSGRPGTGRRPSTWRTSTRIRRRSGAATARGRARLRRRPRRRSSRRCPGRLRSRRAGRRAHRAPIGPVRPGP